MQIDWSQVVTAPPSPSKPPELVDYNLFQILILPKVKNTSEMLFGRARGDQLWFSDAWNPPLLGLSSILNPHFEHIGVDIDGGLAFITFAISTAGPSSP